MVGKLSGITMKSLAGNELTNLSHI